MGLFPLGVKDFAVDQNGAFWVHLDEACNAKFENELHYDRNVSGKLRYGMIDELTGLEAQDLFLWLQVMSIRVDVPTTGLIYFDVGAASKSFPLSLFETPPECVAIAGSQQRKQTLQKVCLFSVYIVLLCDCISFIVVFGPERF